MIYSFSSIFSFCTQTGTIFSTRLKRKVVMGPATPMFWRMHRAHTAKPVSVHVSLLESHVTDTGTIQFRSDIKYQTVFTVYLSTGCICQNNLNFCRSLTSSRIIVQPQTKRKVSTTWDHFDLTSEKKVFVLISMLLHPVPLT